LRPNQKEPTSAWLFPPAEKRKGIGEFMTKEMIISANVHEKKVAIIEDGVVTEFYVERSDENQGVVGNLYKGRVMKVLPGMQSAFVDIALERDAFLYVSDFAELLEDEEIIEYRDGADSRAEQRPHLGHGRIRRDDRREADAGHRYGERTGQRYSPPPRVEALSGHPPQESPEGGTDREGLRIQDVVEQLAEIVDESVIQPPPSEEEDLLQPIGPGEAEITPLLRHAERPGEGGLEADLGPEAETAIETVEAAEVEAGEAEESKPGRGRGRRRGKTAESVRGQKKTAAKRGEKPDAAPQPAGGDEESVMGRQSARRTGRRRSSQSDQEGGFSFSGFEAEVDDSEEGSQFQRVTDEDIAAEAGDLLKDAMVQSKIIDQVKSDEYGARPTPHSRTRAEDVPETRVGSLRSQLAPDPSFQRVVDEEERLAVRRETSEPFRYHEDTDSGHYQGQPENEYRILLPKPTSDQPQSEPLHERQDSSWEQESQPPSGHRADEEPRPSDETDDGPSSAAIRDRGWTAEFAVRRGGRGRRRGGRREAPAKKAVEEEKPAADDDAAAAAVTAPHEEEAGAPATLTAAPTPAPEDQAQPVQPAAERPAHRGMPPRPPARRPDRLPPTISELLREGQEILVQIAKEPIAKKGARITSHIALPGRYLVYMPTVQHIGVSRKIGSDVERIRLKRLVTAFRDREQAGGGFIVRTACDGRSEQELQDDMRYLLRTWGEVKKKAERTKSPSLIHRDLDLVQRIIRDHLSEDFSAIRVDSELEYARLVEFVNRIQPKLVKRIKLYVGDQPIFEKYGVQAEIDKALKPRVWLKSGGYIVINQTEALVAIDVNTGKFVGKSDRLEDTITRTNLEAVKEIVRQVRLRDLGGIIVLDLIDMEERKNRQKVMAALQQELQADRAPSKILAINDFGLVAITRKRVRQSLERTLCSPCPYCQGAGLVKSAQTMCFEILEQAKALSKQNPRASDITLRVSPDVAESFRSRDKDVFEELEAYFPVPITLESDMKLHREQFDFAIQ
jgi:ribonuclease G